MLNNVKNGELIDGTVLDFFLSVQTERSSAVISLDSVSFEGIVLLTTSSFSQTIDLFDNKIFVGNQRKRSNFFLKDQPLQHFCKILIPINFHREHWSLCYVDQSNGLIYSYDSFRGRRKKVAGEEESILAEIAKFLNYWGENQDPYRLIIGECPQQTSCACGLFLMKNAMVVLKTDKPSQLSYDLSNILDEVVGLLETSGFECHQRKSSDSDEENEFLE